MKFNAVPVELLLDVFKRLDPQTVDAVSKVNRKFNEVVMKKRLCRPVADSLSLTLLDISHGSRISNGWNGTLLVMKSVVTLNGITKKKSKSLPLSLETTKEHLVAALKKFRLSGVRTVRIRKLPKQLQVPEILTAAEISLSFLANVDCYPGSMRLRCADDVFLDNLIAQEPKSISYRKCKTSFTMEKVLKVVEKASKIKEILVYDFGRIISTTAVEFLKLEQQFKKIFGKSFEISFPYRDVVSCAIFLAESQQFFEWQIYLTD